MLALLVACATPVEHATSTAWAGTTRLPEGVSIDALRASWPEPVQPHASFAVAWSRDVVVVIARAEDGELGKQIQVVRLSRAGDLVELAVAFVGAGSDVSVMNNPVAFVTAPAAAFTGEPRVTLRWDGRTWTARVTYLR